MSGLLFGTGGIPRSTPKPANLLNGFKRLAELGLGVTEMEFVYGVRMAESDTSQVAAAAQKYKIKLTAHAPYYINLNAHENDKLVASQDRLMQTARVASLCGANSVAFHAAFYLKDEPAEVFARVKKLLTGMIKDLRRQNR
jgi:deoxyribonuclease-4